MPDRPEDITAALSHAQDPQARERVFTLLYDDLLRLARAELGRRRQGATLNTRALVHETYLKLFGERHADYNDRQHFFATATRAMRQVVIDHARARLADCRGSGAENVDLDALDPNALPVDAEAGNLLALDQALTRLEALDPRLARVMELRFFSGLEVKEIADLLGVSEPTIKRDTRAARAFLDAQLGGGFAE